MVVMRVSMQVIFVTISVGHGSAPDALYNGCKMGAGTITGKTSVITRDVMGVSCTCVLETQPLIGREWAFTPRGSRARRHTKSEWGLNAAPRPAWEGAGTRQGLG